MRDLERELRAARVEWPATPDLAAAVRVRLEPHGRRRPWRRVVAVLAALLVGAVAVVEPARSAVLELLGLGSVRIEREEPAAPVRPPGTGLQLGRPVTQAEADRVAGFSARPPAALGAPDGIFVNEGPPRRVSFTYAPRGGIAESAQTGVGVLVTLFPPTVRPFVEKSVGVGADLRRFRIDGSPALFISGAPHGIVFDDSFEQQRLAGTTLLVERPDLLIRVEGQLDQRGAAAIARSVPVAAP